MRVETVTAQPATPAATVVTTGGASVRATGRSVTVAVARRGRGTATVRGARLAATVLEALTAGP